MKEKGQTDPGRIYATYHMANPIPCLGLVKACLFPGTHIARQEEAIMVLGPRRTTYQKALDLGTETRLGGTALVACIVGLGFFDTISLFSATYFRRPLENWVEIP